MADKKYVQSDKLGGKMVIEQKGKTETYRRATRQEAMASTPIKDRVQKAYESRGTVTSDKFPTKSKQKKIKP